jgi:hypothetical protein
MELYVVMKTSYSRRCDIERIEPERRLSQLKKTIRPFTTSTKDMHCQASSYIASFEASGLPDCRCPTFFT